MIGIARTPFSYAIVAAVLALIALFHILFLYVDHPKAFGDEKEDEAIKKTNNAAVGVATTATDENDDGSFRGYHTRSSNINAEQEYQETDSTRRYQYLLYECPDSRKPGNNADHTKFNYDEELKLYETKGKEILHNITEFVEHFRTKPIDDYHRSYPEEKALFSEWKRYAFQNVSNGDMIYESATGIGLNIIITAETLFDELGLTNVTFYGNDFVPDSVEVFKTLYNYNNSNNDVFPSKMNLGSICTSDSRNLSYIPSESFDYVYSGYITPLQDPFEYGTEDWADRLEEEVCDSENATQLIKVMQQKQDVWYRQWLSEMIRIAKPGATIMVEENAEPFCDMTYDWGGVSSAEGGFWYTLDGIDYDNEPIYMERQKYVPEYEDSSDDNDGPRRYHVLMKKKKTNV